MNTKYKDVFDKKKQREMRNFFLDVVGPLGSVESYKKGTTICKDMAEDLYIVKNGRINISLNESDGEEQLIYIIVSGELLGEFEMFSEISQNYLLYFVENTEIWRIPKEKVEEKLLKNPEAYKYFIHSMTRKYNLALYQVSFNRFYSVEERIIEFLLRLAKVHYPNREIDIKVEGYTHEDIGNNINSSRIAITNILKELKKKELIEIKRKLIIIKSIDLLTKYREGLRRR